MRALGARQIGSSADLAIRLYATATQLHREIAMSGGEARATGSGRPALVTSHPKYIGEANGRQTKLSAALMALSIEEREALLLVALEGFDHGEAARILRISRAVLIGRLTQARTALDAQLQNRTPAPRSPASHLRVVNESVSVSAAASFAEADLHAFVDGLLESERRPAVLRRLAASPADRARVEAWQSQNDLIRAAFAGIEREPLPAMLDLEPVRHLRRVAEVETVPVIPKRPARSGRVFAGLLSLCLVVAGLGGAWAWLAPDDLEPQTIAAASRNDTIEETLGGPRHRGARERRAIGTPVRRLCPGRHPDLTAAGFVMTRVATEPTQPISLVLHYENADADRLVLSVAQASGATTVSPKRVGETYSWRQHEKAFALAGTVMPERLRAIATALQGGD